MNYNWFFGNFSGTAGCFQLVPKYKLILNHIKGTTKDFIGDCDNVLSDQEVERVLKKLMASTTSVEVSKSLESLRPASLRKLIKELSMQYGLSS